MNILPKAKLNGVVIQEFDKELLIYDLEEHKALCLNETAAFIWQKCDGKTTFDELIDLSAGGFTNELILLTLLRLQKEKLLEAGIGTELSDVKLSRRQMVAKFGRVGIALPIITAMLVPTSANAQSLQTRNCTALPIPYPAGCTFGSSAVDCPTCQNTLMQVTPTICQSGTSSIDSICTTNTDPSFVNCTAICT